MASRDDVSATVCARNLNYSTTPATLGQAVAQFGTIKEARVITTRFRGEVRSAGYGFIQFESVEAKDKAVAASPVQVEGRNVTVIQAKPPISTLFLGGIPEGVTEQDIKGVYPNATEIKVFPAANQRTGFAFVTLPSTDEFNEARKNRQVTIGNANVRVQVARSRPTERRTAFIFGVTPEITEEQIKAQFPKATAVRRPRSGSYLFVIFASNEDLMNAIKDVREFKVGEVTLKVRIARSAVRGQRRFNGRRRGGFRRGARRGGYRRRGGFRRAPRRNQRTKPAAE